MQYQIYLMLPEIRVFLVKDLDFRLTTQDFHETFLTNWEIARHCRPYVSKLAYRPYLIFHRVLLTLRPLNEIFILAQNFALGEISYHLWEGFNCGQGMQNADGILINQKSCNVQVPCEHWTLACDVLKRFYFIVCSTVLTFSVTSCFVHCVQS